MKWTMKCSGETREIVSDFILGQISFISSKQLFCSLSSLLFLGVLSEKKEDMSNEYLKPSLNYIPSHNNVINTYTHTRSNSVVF